jgi:leucyl aminopeptidase
VTTLATSTAAPASLKADALVIGVAKGPKGLVLATGSETVAKALGTKLAATLASLGATGKADEVTRLATLGKTSAPVLVAVGLGDAGKTYPHERLRRAAGAAVRALAGTPHVALALPSDDEASLRAVAEGAALGGYTFTSFRHASLDRHTPEVDKVTVVTSHGAAKAVVKRAAVVAAAVRRARDLVNTPPSHLHPVELAAAAVEEAARVGIPAEVLDEKALKKGGFGGILGVGQGSSNPPRLVHLSYRPRGATTTVALVGKGITFDSGGISIKPAAGMEAMKSDMSGAAAVIAATAAAAELGLKVNVECWVPMAENMPSGTAIRPSDVLSMRNGKKVEVNNTDAEGRLILGDAMARACEDEPDVLVDVATLTGAQVVALGSRTAAVMGNDDDFRSQVVAAAESAGEAMWPMPLPEELRKGLDSEVADLVNTGAREGGMLSAGIFLREFVTDDVRWAHLDIAGPAFHDGSPYGYVVPGGTGHAVRTLVELLGELAG